MGAISYFVLMVLLTVAVILSLSSENPAVYSTQSAADVTRAMCEVCILLMVVHTVIHEVVEVLRY